MDPFSFGIATNLATDLLKAISRRAFTAGTGGPERRAMRRAFSRAFEELLTSVRRKIGPDPPPDTVALVESQLRMVVNDQAVADMLGDAALNGLNVDVDELRARFEELGFDQETFLVDFDEAMAGFRLALAEELLASAGEAGSALFNRFVLAQFEALRQQMATLTGRRTPSVVEGGEKRIDQSVYIADKAAGFVGRDFAFDAVDDFLESVDSGYLIIRGDPGIGKTAFMAELVRRRGYVHHFNLQAEGITRADQFVGNVRAQLIERYGLSERPSAGRVPETTTLSEILVAAARSSPDGVVVLIDSLDEAASELGDEGANPLRLPFSLPPGCRIVASTRRTSPDVEVAAANVTRLDLRADAEENRADVREYIESFLRRSTLAGLLGGSEGTSLPELVATIEGRSEGNFMYLHHILPEMGRLRNESEMLRHLEELPRGLRGYYQRHWDSLTRRSTAPAGLLHRTIAVLAAARQPCAASLLANVIGVTKGEALRSLEQFQEYLQMVPSRHGSLFRLYHSSYRDFIDDRGLDDQKAWADYFWRAWTSGRFSATGDGSMGGLPAHEREYGQRHLAAHLAEVEEGRSLLAGLVSRAWRDAWRLVDSSDEGFLRDVVLARDSHPGDIPLAIRCCLCGSTVASAQATMPSRLPRLLVQAGLMTFDEALQRARRTPNEYRRASQLAELTLVAPATAIAAIFAVARRLDSAYAKATAFVAIVLSGSAAGRESVARALPDLDDAACRLRVLVALMKTAPPASLDNLASTFLETIPHLRFGFEVRDEFRAAIPLFPPGYNRALVRSIRSARQTVPLDDWDEARLLLEIARRAQSDDWESILDALSTIRSPWYVAHSLGDIWPMLPSRFRDTGTKIAELIRDREARLAAFRSIGHRPSRNLVRKLVEKARRQRDGGVRANSLARLVEFVDEPQKSALLNEAMRSARKASTPLEARVDVFAAMPLEMRGKAIEHVFAALDRHDNPYSVVQAALRLAAKLGPEEAREKSAVRSRLLAAIDHPPPRDYAWITPEQLIEVAALTEGATRRALILRAHQETRRMLGAEQQLQQFRKIFPGTPTDMLDMATQTARAITDEEERAEALIDVAASIPMERARPLIAEARRQFDTLLDEAHAAEACIALAEAVEGPVRNRFLLEALEHLEPGMRRKRIVGISSDRHEIEHPQTIIVSALRAVVPEEAEPELVTHIHRAALAAALQIGASTWRARALVDIAPYVGSDVFRKLLSAAEAFDGALRLEIVLAQAEARSGDERRSLLREAIGTAPGVESRSFKLFESMGRVMDDDTADEVFRLLAEEPDPWAQRNGLEQIAPYLSGVLRPRALTLARALPPLYQAPSLGSRDVVTEILEPRPPSPPWRPSSSHGRRRSGSTPTHDEWIEALAKGETFSEGGTLARRTERLVDLTAKSLSSARDDRAERVTVTLRALAGERRPKVLREIAVLAPVLASLYRNQDDALAGCAAILDICHWPL